MRKLLMLMSLVATSAAFAGDAMSPSVAAAQQERRDGVPVDQVATTTAPATIAKP